LFLLSAFLAPFKNFLSGVFSLFEDFYRRGLAFGLLNYSSEFRVDFEQKSKCWSILFTLYFYSGGLFFYAVCAGENKKQPTMPLSNLEKFPRLDNCTVGCL